MGSPAERIRVAVSAARALDTAESREAAVERITPSDIEQLMHRQFTGGVRTVLTRGIGASPGAASGRIYFSAEDAMDAADRGEQVILACAETSPADEIAMRLSDGILTSRGGLASHAAVVARGWGIPAVCGAIDIEFGERTMIVGEIMVREGDLVSLDGSSGEILLGELEVGDEDVPDELGQLLEWADAIRVGHLAVRANVDTGEDARLARLFGAEGVGLCRTEHQFFGEKLPIVQRYILAEDPEEERAALALLIEAQRADYVAVFEAMDGLPVTMRLLDPPLHEFLPDPDDPDADPGLIAAAHKWREHNPMLGTRGVRLAILKPGLYRAQVRAIIDAARERRAAGGNPMVEILIPLVADARELVLVRDWIAEEVSGDEFVIEVGTMIETPRAALLAGELASECDFFSIGTNDLTQMVYGFSRDDVERRLLGVYESHGIVDVSPFESIDAAGVGILVRRAVLEGRLHKPGLRVGVCGEHGGDPESIAFFLEAGIDYVSCSAYRVPVARLAAAQAVLRSR